MSRFLAAARSSLYHATSQKYASAIEATSNPSPLPTSILDETALLSSSQLHHRTNEVAEAEAKKINAAYEFFTRKYQIDTDFWSLPAASGCVHVVNDVRERSRAGELECSLAVDSPERTGAGTDGCHPALPNCRR